MRILPSFLKGIRILECIAAEPRGVRLKDIADRLELPASNVTLYLNTLVASGVALRDPVNKRYCIAPEAIEQFRTAGEGLVHRLVPCAEEPMKKLHARFNENVLLGYPKAHSVIFIKHLTSRHVMRIGIEPVPEFPMHVTAAGRAILAYLPQRELDRYLDQASFRKITSRTVTSKKTLQAIFEEVRERGFAFNPGEFEEDVMALAAPIRVAGRAIASLTVQYPTIRHTQDEVLTYGPAVVEQAAAVERALNARTEAPSPG
ncbi:IclR family transcriptional regulator [Kiritimatiella glycovorans]|uniref:IclR family transcriptional regulator n=1 Tax=Kiritimatiella glycovorans TaxID=1307763 RepID=A0A0G3EGA2_9BACT|nr:IclR family transcriptional regulator [Kiritimatiella glycovorans]AKJ65368.1 IclR family transcriptional regulator [Kiritimatiella glycovorans]